MLNRPLDKPELFSDATCNRLVGLLLRASAVEAAHQVPAWFAAELESVANQDVAFAKWLHANFIPERDSVLELCRRLVRGQHTCTNAATDSAAASLHDCAFVVLRLASLSASFADELDGWQQRQLYNLAYGLSHELNNPLANIVTRAGVLAQQTRDPQSQQLLQTIVDSAHRGREMLGDLMTLARPPAIECRPHGLSTIVAEATNKIGPWSEARGVTIELLETDESQDCLVLVDASAMRETLWTIIRNALEAMPSGGRLSVCSYVNSASAESADAASRAWGVIEISDTGPGLTAISLKNCFDPFYSGREAGRGLGLGLSKAKALMHRQHGHIEIENLPTKGCRVTLWLPQKT